MIEKSEIDRLDQLRQSTDPDIKFLSEIMDRITGQWKAERDVWSLLLIRIGKPLGCLGSCFPDGNEHILKAAQKAAALRLAVKPFIEHDGDAEYWDQFGGDAWDALRLAYSDPS